MKNLRVEVEFFDDQRGTLSLQFDGSKTWRIPNAAYASVNHVVNLTGAKRWKTEIFHLHDGTFNNAQNGQADFRLAVVSGDFYVRRVTVTRESADLARTAGFASGGDFSSTNTVSLPLGDPSQERECGLLHLAAEGDGRTGITNIDGTACRYSAMAGKRWAYMYFALDDSFKSSGIKDVDIEVECFDVRPTAFNLEFDASNSRDISAPAFAKTNPDARLRGLHRWQTNVFHIRNATFANAQNGHADFRLIITPADLFVRRVTVTRQPSQR